MWWTVVGARNTRGCRITPSGGQEGTAVPACRRCWEGESHALSIAECRSVLYPVFLSGTHHGDRPAAVWVQKGMAELGRKGELVPCLRLYRQGYSESGGGACITKAENGHRRKESIVH